MATKAKRKWKDEDEVSMGKLSHDDTQLYHDTHALRVLSQKSTAEV